MSTLRKLRALVLGQEQAQENNIYGTLTASGIPVASADCRTCPNPCDEGHSEYPRRFSVDMECPLLGSVKPFRRQILISTGKSDWDKEITETPGSLAALVSQTQPPKTPSATLPISIGLDTDAEKILPSVPGVFSSTDSTRLSILNGSHKTVCRAPGVTQETSSFQTWILPYSCVIMLCSHKRRDNRCAIAAPKLEQAFIKSLESKGWTADTQLEHIMEPPLEKFSGTADEKENYIADELKALSGAKKALILRNSHMGGHKYAGNCIIYMPQGSSVWYGRVTTHEVESIVVNTLEGGLVLPPLLRGGMDLCRPGCPTLHDW
ncbi:Sucrase/ferredoxin-like-domain-containing protein [Mycena galericulata]|nr:Sucrase/ferredoxin-like-domain-containing protein [Mycena galericulata]